MEMNLVLDTLRDPAGVPAHPVLMQVLMVFTWILHIFFVMLTMGAAALAIYAFHKRGKYNQCDNLSMGKLQYSGHWEHLSMAMTKVAKIGVSLLIVLGVAPLLFTQVIYDPQWYVSNVLSGQWVIGFIFTLIIAYCLWFAFYYANKPGAKQYTGVYAWLAFALFLLDGLIMHALSWQSLQPDQWMNWYAPNGVVDTSGASLHSVQWPRYLFIMGLSAPVIGGFLQAYAHYFSVRPDRSQDYLNFVRVLGYKIAEAGLYAAIALGLCWQLMQPAELGLLWHPIGWAILLLLGGMLYKVRQINKKDGMVRCGYKPLIGVLSLIALLAVWREVIRIHYMLPYDYSIADYPVNVDWPSTLLFFLTFIGIGGSVGGFYLTLLYRAGRTAGVYQAEPAVIRLSNLAVGLLIVWIAVFFVYGISIWLSNSFLV